MEISGAKYDNSIQLKISQSSADNELKQTISLTDGSMLKGEIINIAKGSITIKLEDQSQFTAALKDFENMKGFLYLSQIQDFKLSLDSSKTPVLELMNISSKAQSDVFKEALTSAGLTVNSSTIKLVEELIKNQMPIDKNTIQELYRGFRQMGIENVDKALFLIENGMKINKDNISKLDNLLEFENKLSDQINVLAKDISQMEASAIKEKIFDIIGVEPDILKIPFDKTEVNYVENDHNFIQSLKDFVKNHIESVPGLTTASDTNIEIEKATKEFLQNSEKYNDIAKFLNPEQIKDFLESSWDMPPFESKKSSQNKVEGDESNPNVAKKISQKLMFKLKGKDQDDIKKFISDFTDKLNQIKEQLSKAPQSKELLKTLNNLQENINYTNQIKNNYYIQLPLLINHKETNTGLYVFKDKRTKKIDQTNQSALISLDLANLGYFEVYIQKNKNNIYCQFRLKNDDVQNLVRQNIQKLDGLLSEKNYKLNGYSFKEIKEQFSILEKEPAKSESISITTGSIDIRT